MTTLNRYTFRAFGVLSNGMTTRNGRVAIRAESEQSAQGLARAELNKRCRKKGAEAPAKWILDLVSITDDGEGPDPG